MLTTKSSAWNALHSLKSRLSGRLARFKRHTQNHISPGNSQNDAAFFEADLRYILTIPYPVIDISESNFHDMHQKVVALLGSLENMVNQHLIDRRRFLHILPDDYDETSPRGQNILGTEFPRLNALLRFLDTSPAQFDLINGPGITLFTMPHGELASLASERISNWRKVLVKLFPYTQNSRSNRFSAFSQDKPSSDITLHEKPSKPQSIATLTVDAILRDIKQLSCNEVHEIKLGVPDKSQFSEDQSSIDMFVSSGPGGDLWKETQCGLSEGAVEEPERRSICAAIQHATAQNRKLYLFIDYDEAIIDISEQYPPKPSSSDDFIVESLAQLLEQKILTKFSYRDYVERTATTKMSTKDKAILALSLARCLMDFIDGEADLEFFNWRPETIDFIRPSGTDAEDRRLHIRLKPYVARSRPADMLKKVKPGNPILLSFAKLLLEIESGERIPMQIHSDNRENWAQWAELCGFVNEESMERNGNFIRAVEGCLYLYRDIRTARQDENSSHTGDILRTTIYEQIVKNLELVVDPPTSKRKGNYSIPDFRNSKKPSLLPPSPSVTLSRQTMFGNQTVPIPEFARPQSRHDFEIAIICALPLEYDAVCLLFDDFWGEECDSYCRIEGDPNIYTTGHMGKINVVLVLLPNIGTVRAASTAASLRLSCPKVRLVIVSGICGGVPFPAKNEELILGDVVISTSIVQYDFGKEYPSEFMMNDIVEDSLGRASLTIRNKLSLLRTKRARDLIREMASLNLGQLQEKFSQESCGPTYKYPGACEDRLFQSDYIHKHRQSFQCLCTRSQTADLSNCQISRKLLCKDLGCDDKHLVQRKRIELKQKLEEGGKIKEAQVPSIFVGCIGSADRVLKSGQERDRLSRQHEIFAFEMEGAGVWDEIPTIIVKAACDYADSHKNDLWQNFAAATAASVTKALIQEVFS